MKSSRLVAKLLKLYNNELDAWSTVEERAENDKL